MKNSNNGHDVSQPVPRGLGDILSDFWDSTKHEVSEGCNWLISK